MSRRTLRGVSIRNHGGVPDIEEDAFELEFGGLVNKPCKLTMKDLKDLNKFPYVSFLKDSFLIMRLTSDRQMELTVTLQCSGTRRIEQASNSSSWDQ